MAETAGLRERFRPYRAVLASRARSQRAYRTSFALDMGGSVLVGLVELAEVWVLFRNVTALGGMRFNQILLVFGMADLTFAMADLSFGHLDTLPDYLRAGTLDAFYLRPQPILLQLITSDISLRRLARAAVGAAALGIGLVTAGVSWGPRTAVLLSLALISGYATFAALFVWAAGLQFFLLDGAEMTNAFVYGGRYAASQPASVWSRPLKLVFGFFFPMAFTAACPARTGCRPGWAGAPPPPRRGRGWRGCCAGAGDCGIIKEGADEWCDRRDGWADPRVPGTGRKAQAAAHRGRRPHRPDRPRRGRRLHRRERRRKVDHGQVGVVFGQRSQLWWDLPVRESFRILAAIHGLTRVAESDRTAELVERLELGDFLSVPVRQLSLGQRMRAEVAAALRHSPSLVILDEPTIGLDVLSKQRLREFLVSERHQHGTTLLLTTHDMGDVERLCNRILVIDHGRLAYDGDLPGLSRTVGAERVLVVDLAEPVPDLTGLDGARHLSSAAGGLRQRLAFDAEHTTAAKVLAAVSDKAEVLDLTVEEPDIEDVVRRIYAAGR